LPIERRSIAHIVTDTIYFDRQPRSGTIEIQNVGTYGVLAAKYGLSIFASAKPAP
jgi:hypothetical protein